MQRSPARRRSYRAWRVFEIRDARCIEEQLQDGLAPSCPCCRAVLEARPTSRMRRTLPLDARGYDLDCRECRRFFCIVRHTTRSLRLLRMRRLVAAVRAVGQAGGARHGRGVPVAGAAAA